MYQGDIIVTNYDTSLVPGMYLLNEVFYLTASIAAIHIFYGSIIISPEHLKRSICEGHCVYFTTLVVTIHIHTITSDLWLIRENSRMFLFEESHCSTSLLKVQSCKLDKNKYMIASAQITNTEIFALIAVLDFKFLTREVLFINRKDNGNC